VVFFLRTVVCHGGGAQHRGAMVSVMSRGQLGESRSFRLVYLCHFRWVWWGAQAAWAVAGYSGAGITGCAADGDRAI